MILNEMKEDKIELSQTWELGDLISFFKGKGDKEHTINQIKVFETILGENIEPIIRGKNTSTRRRKKSGITRRIYIYTTNNYRS